MHDIGPLQFDTPAKKSNRGRKPMKSAILTSPENVAAIHQKAAEKQLKLDKQARKNEEKAPPKKRARRLKSTTATNRKSSSEEEEGEFCTICMKAMPKKMNKNNTIHCNECDRAFHLKCVTLKGDFYTCVHCEESD